MPPPHNHFATLTKISHYPWAGKMGRSCISLQILKLQEDGEAFRLKKKWWRDRSECGQESAKVSLETSIHPSLLYFKIFQKPQNSNQRKCQMYPVFFFAFFMTRLWQPVQLLSFFFMSAHCNRLYFIFLISQEIESNSCHFLKFKK